MYALNLSEDNRILSATFEEYATDDMPKVETLPDGDISDYKYVDGVYVYDPLPKADDNSTRIAELKQMLADTDYIVIKIAEGVATWDEYPGIKEQRQVWREEINKLEQTSTTEQVTE